MEFRRKALTLIELLVVIEIMAVLAAIMFPVFAQAKKAANGAVCLSNAKQLALAGFLYVNDYHDAYEPFETPLNQTSQFQTTGYWFLGVQDQYLHIHEFRDSTRRAALALS